MHINLNDKAKDQYLETKIDQRPYKILSLCIKERIIIIGLVIKGRHMASGLQNDRHRGTSGAKECFSSIGRFSKK